MRTNSPIDDPVPFQLPEIKTPEKVKKNDWERLVKSKKYPEIKEYLESRKEFYRRYLPGGVAVTDVKEVDSYAWKLACTLITELEMFESIALRQATAEEVRKQYGIQS